MKKLLVLAAVAIIATAGFYGKKQKEEKEQLIIEDMGIALAEQVVTKLEETLKKQVDDFWKNNDFGQAVGWSEEDKQKLTNSLQEYVNNYEWDTQELEVLKDNVTKLLNDSELLKSLKGITKEELDAKLAEILSGQ